MDQLPQVPVSGTEMVLRRIVMPSMLNPNGTMFGGALLSIYDEFSGIVGLGFARGKVMTVSIERVTFRRPLYAGQTLVIRGRVVHAGRTSFAVLLQTQAEQSGVPLGSAGSALFHYVAVDDSGRPVPVPRLLPQTEEERQLWQELEDARQSRREKERLC